MTETKIKPLEDRILVLPDTAEEFTKGGIIIPESAKEKPQKGVIVSVGDGNKDIEMQVKIGDTILYNKHAGSDLSLNGKDHLIIRQSDILLVI